MAIKLIKDMQVGDGGYVTAWAIAQFDNMTVGIQTKLPISDTQGGTATVYVTLTQNGYEVDLEAVKAFYRETGEDAIMPSEMINWHVDVRGLLPIYRVQKLDKSEDTE